MRIGYLYVTSNTVDDLLYVGQSSRMDPLSLETYLGSGDYFQHAIADLGAEKFSKRIVDFYDEQPELDYAEVHLIAKLRADGITLYNGGIGGPRAQQPFIRAMFQTFGVVPLLVDKWFRAVDAHKAEVLELIVAGAVFGTNDFYVELAGQLAQTQDLTGECSKCGAAVGSVCQTKTGNPTKNHAGRRVNP